MLKISMYLFGGKREAPDIFKSAFQGGDQYGMEKDGARLPSPHLLGLRMRSPPTVSRRAKRGRLAGREAHLGWPNPPNTHTQGEDTGSAGFTAALSAPPREPHALLQLTS